MEPYEPCPNCGNEDEFRQKIQQMEDVTIYEDEGGHMEDITVVSDSFTIVSVACIDCETVIYGDDSIESFVLE